ncbi:MAG: carboxypeptidase regulatory-like domain-containing protein [Acidobacteria bacterium]|nr:carboxypeptidase regulatory-like domain-containing protein [Acidobacteriota bacterium]
MKYINRQIARAGGVVVAGFVMALLAQGSFAQVNISRGSRASYRLPANIFVDKRIETGDLAPQTASFTEDFAAVPTVGWNYQNLSTPIGLIPNWIQGDSSVFPAQAGAGTAYAGASFNSVAGANTISNWMFAPEILFRNGDVIRFWTRKAAPAPTDFPDRMQVRLSLNGNSVNAGATNTSVGDFTTLLLDINSAQVVGGYPVVWQQFSITISGLASPTNGRVAFRYFVTNGGPSGANSDYIGVDTFEYIATPTAAGVSVGGRVLTGERGLSNARVTLTSQDGQARQVVTGAFGYYRFDDVVAGQTYILSVNSKRYAFSPRVVSINQDIADLDLIALEN